MSSISQRIKEDFSPEYIFETSEEALSIVFDSETEANDFAAEVNYRLKNLVKTTVVAFPDMQPVLNLKAVDPKSNAISSVLDLLMSSKQSTYVTASSPSIK